MNTPISSLQPLSAATSPADLAASPLATNLKFPLGHRSRQSDLGFWQWLVNHPSIPLCTTEGAKAGALLTAGYAAIALPGVNGGYRVQRDELGNRISTRLIPQLLKLATNRFISPSTKTPTTIKSERCYPTAGILASTAGCPVKVILGTWNWARGG